MSMYESQELEYKRDLSLEQIENIKDTELREIRMNYKIKRIKLTREYSEKRTLDPAIVGKYGRDLSLLVQEELLDVNLYREEKGLNDVKWNISFHIG